MPLTLCHYDFDNRNLGFRTGPDGPQTVVIDWEIVGVGLSSADVGRFLTYQNPPNMPELLDHYLNELERALGHTIDREQWYKGFEIVAVAIWQIVASSSVRWSPRRKPRCPTTSVKACASASMPTSHRSSRWRASG